MVAHDLALFGLLLGFHGQLEKWADFGVDRGRGGIRGLTRLLIFFMTTCAEMAGCSENP